MEEDQLPNVQVETVNIEDCDVCGGGHSTAACGQLKRAVADSVAPSRALLTLPPNLRIKSIPSPKESSEGKMVHIIRAREKILKGTRFGPVEAPLVAQLNSRVNIVLKVFSKDGSSMYLDTTCPSQCNWMSLLSAARSIQTHNLIACQVEEHIYFVANRDIRFNEELRVWYAPFYAKKIGITDTLPSIGNKPNILKRKKRSVTPDEVPKESEIPTYQLRERSERSRKRKKYEDFVNLNDEDEDEDEELGNDEKKVNFKCSKCEELFESGVSFAAHLIKHLESEEEKAELLHKCHFCQNIFSSLVDLQQHYLSDHGESVVINVTDPINNISDADAATILLQIEANGDKNEDPQNLSPENSATLSISCEICGETLDSKLELIEHLRTHSDKFVDKELICVFCQKVFDNARDLKLHIDEHTGTFTCFECNKTFSSKEFHDEHVCFGTKTKDENFTCQICHKSFSKLNYLECHIPMHTGNNACPVCGKWLRSPTSLVNHLRICSQPMKDLEAGGSAVCSICKQSFSELSEYRQHMFQHRHAFCCEHCGARFRNRIKLQAHACFELLNVECDVCGSKFIDPASVKEHKSQVHHLSPDTIKCDKCQKCFNTKNLLENHECLKSTKESPKVNLEPLVCSTCGAKFSAVSSLNVHKKLHGEKQHVCEVCGKKFHRKDLMLDHWAVHGEPTVPCPICNKMFKTKKALDVHLSLHDGVKRYSCEVCGRTFNQKGNLVKHSEVHNPSRKYQCEQCPKSYSTKEYLSIHLQEHALGRTFTCETCGKTFVKQHQMHAHQRTFHSNCNFVCAFCGINVKFRHSLRRHLLKKHSDVQEQWSLPEQVDAMQVASPAPPPVLTKVTEAVAVETEAEMVLQLSGVGSETLQQALMTGAARIQHGSAPNTFEITLPIAPGHDLGSVDGREEDEMATTHILQLPAPADGANEGDVPGQEMVKEEEEQYQIAFSSVGENEMDAQIALTDDQQLLSEGSEILLVDESMLKESANEEEEEKVYFYVINSTDEGVDETPFSL